MKKRHRRCAVRPLLLLPHAAFSIVGLASDLRGVRVCGSLAGCAEQTGASVIELRVEHATE